MEDESTLSKKDYTLDVESVANITHELRTPLNAIINLSNFLENTSLSSQQKNYVNMIKNSSITLNTIVNDLLDFSKLNSGKNELSIEPLNLRKVLETSIAQIEPKAVEKNIVVAYSIDPNVELDYLGDSYKITRILNNLLSNGVKFTNKGNITVEVSKKNPSDCIQGHTTLLFKIKDTGIGISEGDIKLLFRPFKQLCASQSIYNKASSGTGLGLTICKDLIELMGGKIWVESKPNKGSTFSFTINLTPYFDPQSLLEYYKKHFNGKNVLIVDDNECNRQVLFDITLRWDMNPFLCQSGKDALMYTQSSKALDIAFIDIRMPEMDGIELASKIKAIRPSLPLIAVSSIGTSFGDPENYFMFKLEKPLEEYKLGTVVMEVFSKENVLDVPKEKSVKVKDVKPLKILIVEDEKINRFVLTEMLKNHSSSHSIDEAENGIEAVAKSKENDYDVIFVDLIMPYMNGYEATREILKHKSPYIIAVTASTEVNVKDKCYRCGCKGYISKPVIDKELETMLEVISEKL